MQWALREVRAAYYPYFDLDDASDGAGGDLDQLLEQLRE
jgi:hypothetical protein